MLGHSSMLIHHLILNRILQYNTHWNLVLYLHKSLLQVYQTQGMSQLYMYMYFATLRLTFYINTLGVGVNVETAYDN